ncbi:MAG: prepilin-type N-terminal cleavage/methylation domain-containing protein [Phycisphaerae bacterium]
MLNRNQPSNRVSAYAFTLIELLVVVAIISTLIAILLPSLSVARATTRTSICASNMRQLGVGAAMYADANRGSMIPGRPARFGDNSLNVYPVGNGLQWRPRWYVRMGAECGFYAFNEPSTDPARDNTLLITSGTVFTCPEVAERLNNRNAPYGYNFQFLGNTRFKGGQEARGFIRFPVKIENLNAAGTVMAADALGTAAGRPAATRTDYRIDGGSELTAIGNHAWSLDPPRLTATSDYCDDNNRTPENRSAPDERHRTRANTLFVDGHVTALSARSLGYVQDGDGRFLAELPNSADITNRLFSGSGRDDDPPPIN